MDAEHVTVTQPNHPLPELTTYELRDYRRDLEQAIAALPGRAPARGHLRRRLAEVLAEQESRAAAARGRA